MLQHLPKFPAGVEAFRQVAVLAPRFRRNPHRLEHLHLPQRFRQRQKRGALHRIRRSLGIRVKRADRFDRVAKKFDADRLGRLGRKDVDDTAAHRILPRHLARRMFLVSRVVQKFDKILVPNRLIARDRARQTAIELRFAHPPQHRLQRSNHDVGLARRQPPQCYRARLRNFCVRRTSFIWQHVVRWKPCHAPAGLSGHRLVKPAHRVEQRFGPLIRIDHHDHGPSKLAECDRHQQGLRRIGEPGEIHFAALAAQPVARFIDGRQAANPSKKFRNQRKNHIGRWAMRSINCAVE